MTAESETSREPGPTRRGVLLGVGLAGLGGTLAGCSTAAVPYGANEAGQVPGSAPTSSAMARPATSSGAPPGSAPSGRAMPSASSGSKSRRAVTTGTVLSAASEIPVGGGKIFTAEKVVVTQPARGQYRAFSAVCTHVGCILDKVANGVIGCPCHGGQFTVTTGTVVAGPPPIPLPRKRIKIVDGKVVLL